MFVWNLLICGEGELAQSMFPLQCWHVVGSNCRKRPFYMHLVQCRYMVVCCRGQGFRYLQGVWSWRLVFICWCVKLRALLAVQCRVLVLGNDSRFPIDLHFLSNRLLVLYSWGYFIRGVHGLQCRLMVVSLIRILGHPMHQM